VNALHLMPRVIHELVHRTLSPAAMAAAGWERVDARPWTKTRACWRHHAGWRLEHCGHPTALYPWALFAPSGAMHCTGALFAEPPNPDHGWAWPNLALAVHYVAHAPALAAARAKRRARRQRHGPR
jgi:hypothetical protein